MAIFVILNNIIKGVLNMALGRSKNLYMVDEAWEFLDELFSAPSNQKARRGRGSFAAEILLREKMRREKKESKEEEML